MECVVVTGAAGFIGRYIVSEALSSGYKVIGIDNFSKYGENSNTDLLNKNYELIESDARNVDELRPYFMEADHVIAGAAMIGGISYFHTYAYDLLATNERIMASTVDAAIEAFQKGKLKKLTYLSSSMVYESVDTWPSKEGDEKTSPPPISSYGFQKLAVEYYARAAWDQYKLPYTILRPFNCVGLGEKRAKGDEVIMSGNVSLAMSHVVPDLIQKILKGQNPLHILGDGSQVRCYTYGGDLAKGIVRSLNHASAVNEDFNISTARAHTVLDIARLIWEKVYGSSEDFKFVSDTPFSYDVQKRIPDTSKAARLLGIECNTPIEDVLDELIPWIKEAISLNLI